MQLTGDEIHVLLDAIDGPHGEPWKGYDPDPDDPKTTPGGWDALLSSAQEKLGQQLNVAGDEALLRKYEVTWLDGRTEPVQGHEVVFGSNERFTIYDTSGTKWQIMLNGRMDKLDTIRDVTSREEKESNA